MTFDQETEPVSDMIEDIRDTASAGGLLLGHVLFLAWQFVVCQALGVLLLAVPGAVAAAATGEPLLLLAAAMGGSSLAAMAYPVWVVVKVSKRGADRPDHRRRPADPNHGLKEKSTGANGLKEKFTGANG